MNAISVTFDIITMIITAYLCVKNIKSLYKSRKYIVFYFVVLIYVIPLFLDYLVGFPVYDEARYSGYNLSEYDTVTRCLFDAFVVFVELMILKWGKNEINLEQDERRYSVYTSDRLIESMSIRRVLYIVTIGSIVLAFIFLRRVDILTTPLWREVFFDTNISGYATFERLSYVGIACGVVLFMAKNISLIGRIIGIVCTYFNICIEGKKSAIIFVLVLVFIVLILRLPSRETSIGKKRKTLLRYAFIGAVLVFLIIRITVYVKINSRGYIADDAIRMYTAFRIDVFRDDRVRMAIYSLLHSDRYQGVPFPGQTYLISVLYLFPLDYIFGSLGLKRILNMHAYSDYLSAALYGGTVETVAGFMTPAIFAELIANFSFLGVLLFPLICIWFANKLDKYDYPINVFILASFVMLQMYSLSYIAYLLEFTLLLCLSTKIRLVIK